MSIYLDGISKRFGNQRVVDQVSLEVANGELFVLLGASGSGKSTILRLIAGLTLPDSGRVLLHGRDVTGLPPQARGTGFVFQNYSIFRHMTVYENIEFGLKIRRMAPAERRERCEGLLDQVGLAGLGDRYSDQLSGGQRQRVALARALAYEPSVLLLDEPFGALDVKIRSQLRRSLKAIQRQLGVTMILVTHDQEEAFELADRIGVIERGRLLEVGESEALYRRPRTLFVSTFLGAGNVLTGRVREGMARFGTLRIPIPGHYEEGARVQLLFRPEQVVLSEARPAAGDPVLGQGEITEQSFIGPTRRVRLRLPPLQATRQVAPVPPFGEEGLLIDAVLPATLSLPTLHPWLSLRGWHILEPARPALLLVDDGAGSLAPLSLTACLQAALDATVTVLNLADNGAEDGTLLAERQQVSGLNGAEQRIHSGNLVEQVMAEQSEALYDMLILDGSRHPEPVLAPLLERPDLPILAVKGEPATIRRVLICTAAGEPGKSDVRIGGELARRLGASVTLLYVYGNGHRPPPVATEHLEMAAATLRNLDVPCDLRVIEAGAPAAGILAEAERGAHDLIVVGGHGPAGRSIFARDDVSLQVIAGAERPVLVVPADEAYL